MARRAGRRAARRASGAAEGGAQDGDTQNGARDADAPAPRLDDLPWTTDPEGLRIMARVTPRGGRDALDGVTRDADGRPTLALRVSAPPDAGRANAAAAALVAGLLGLPRSAVSVERGATSRVKRLRALGAPEALAARLAEAVARAAGSGGG